MAKHKPLRALGDLYYLNGMVALLVLLTASDALSMAWTPEARLRRRT